MIPTAENKTANMNPRKELVANAGATPNFNSAMNRIKNGTITKSIAPPIGIIPLSISNGMAKLVKFEVKLYNT